jgi:hypothetical protein
MYRTNNLEHFCRHFLVQYRCVLLTWSQVLSLYLHWSRLRLPLYRIASVATWKTLFQRKEVVSLSFWTKVVHFVSDSGRRYNVNVAPESRGPDCSVWWKISGYLVYFPCPCTLQHFWSWPPSAAHHFYTDYLNSYTYCFILLTSIIIYTTHKVWIWGILQSDWFSTSRIFNNYSPKARWLSGNISICVANLSYW